VDPLIGLLVQPFPAQGKGSGNRLLTVSVRQDRWSRVHPHPPHLLVGSDEQRVQPELVQGPR